MRSQKRFILSASGVVAGVLGVGCGGLPPVTLPMEGARREAPGSLSAGGAVSYAGDVAQSPFVLGTARVAYQASTNVAVGADLTGGGGTYPALILAPRPPGTPSGPSYRTAGLSQGRVHVRANPNTDHFAFSGGLGGGALFGSQGPPSGYFTVDAGARVSTGGHRIVEGVLAQNLAVSVQPDASMVFWTMFSSTEIGLVFRPAPQFTLGAFLTMLYPFSRNGGAERPLFVPSLAVGYTVGP